MEKTDEAKASSSQHLNLHDLAAHCFDTLLAQLNGKGKNLPKYPEHLPDPEYPIFVTWTKGHHDELRGCIGTFSG